MVLDQGTERVILGQILQHRIPGSLYRKRRFFRTFRTLRNHHAEYPLCIDEETNSETLICPMSLF